MRYTLDGPRSGRSETESRFVAHVSELRECREFSRQNATNAALAGGRRATAAATGGGPAGPGRGALRRVRQFCRSRGARREHTPGFARHAGCPLIPATRTSARSRVVHDYFDVLGLSSAAPASEIRRLWARHPRRWHPDFVGCGSSAPRTDLVPPPADAAVDFVNMTAFTDRMQAAFFGAARLSAP